MVLNIFTSYNVLSLTRIRTCNILNDTADPFSCCNVRNLCILPTYPINNFLVIITTSSHYFAKQY